MAFEFEANIQRELARIRRDERLARVREPEAYLVAPSTVVLRTGLEDGPYGLDLWRASREGDTAQPLPADGSVGGIVLTGQSQRPLCDEFGRVWVRAAETLPELTPLRYASAAFENQTAPVAAVAGQEMRVRWAGMLMSGGAGAGRALMLFDSNVPVVDGALPIWRGVILDAGAGYFNSIDIEFESTGIIVSAGFVLAVSTTLETLTLPPAPPAAAVALFQSIHTFTTL